MPPSVACGSSVRPPTCGPRADPPRAAVCIHLRPQQRRAREQRQHLRHRRRGLGPGDVQHGCNGDRLAAAGTQRGRRGREAGQLLRQVLEVDGALAGEVGGGEHVNRHRRCGHRPRLPPGADNHCFRGEPVMPLGRVANDRLRHLLAGYARVCGRLMHQRPVLEVVRETQAHVPERAGVGQQLPRDGFAPIAAQIGNVTTQRIPDERVVTLEGRTVDPATLDTH